jgi:hypothetical protein
MPGKRPGDGVTQMVTPLRLTAQLSGAWRAANARLHPE